MVKALEPLDPKIQLRHGILEEYHDKDFKDFPVKDSKGNIVPERHEIMRKLLQYCANIHENRKEGIGILFYGMNGVGKTHLAVSVQKYAIRQGYKTQFANLQGIVKLYAAAWYDDEKDEIYQRRVKNVDFLVIDDVGKGFQSKNSDLTPAVFDELMRYRYQRKLPTIITTNASIAKLMEAYGNSVVSLIEGRSLQLFFENPNAFPNWRKVMQARQIQQKFGG